MDNRFLYLEICQNDIRGKATSRVAIIKLMYQRKCLLAVESEDPEGVPISTINAVKIHGCVLGYEYLAMKDPNLAWNTAKIKAESAAMILNVIRKNKKAWDMDTIHPSVSRYWLRNEVFTPENMVVIMGEIVNEKTSKRKRYAFA